MEKLLRILKDINPDIDYEVETELVDGDYFDSLDVMSIVMGISDEFDIDIDPEEITSENFNSAENIWNLIKRSK